MKRKLIIALAAAMTITLGSVGVVSADDTNFAPFIPVKETPIRDGFVWIVDTPAWTEEIKHPAETEDKWVVDKEAVYETVHHPAVTEKKWIVDKEAWTEEVQHPAETEDKWVVDKEAWTETVNHPEEGHEEIRTICHNCGADITGHAADHIQENALNGCLGYGDKVIWIVDKPAWTETINHPEEGHTETVVTKPAWTEKVEHPEVGHWEPIPENPDEQEPETPQNPDEQEPETPQNPDEQEPETPQNPDEQNPETPDNNQNNNENNNQNENNSQNNNENTSQNNNSSETNNSQDDSTGKQPPKTGDPTSFASLYALAGSALAGIGAVKLKFRKRK